jgi:hypothetical protein
MSHPASRSRAFAILVVFLGLESMLASFTPSCLLAADQPAVASNTPQLAIGKGQFVSFEDGVLTLEGSAFKNTISLDQFAVERLNPTAIARC